MGEEAAGGEEAIGEEAIGEETMEGGWDEGAEDIQLFLRIWGYIINRNR